MRAKGFTLVEMLVVIGILALIMTLVPPLLAGGQARVEFTTTAHDLAAALRETRSRAIDRGHTEAFEVDTAAGTFRGVGGRVRHVAAGIRLALVTLAEDRRDQTVGDIRFFADGSSTGGDIRLSQGKRQSDVLVDWLTGRVSVQEGMAIGR